MRKRLSILIVLAMLFQAFAFISASAEGEIVFGTVTYNREERTIMFSTTNLKTEDVTKIEINRFNSDGEWVDNKVVESTAAEDGKAFTYEIKDGAFIITLKEGQELKKGYKYHVKVVYNGGEKLTDLFETESIMSFEASDDLFIWMNRNASYWRAYHKNKANTAFTQIGGSNGANAEMRLSVGIGGRARDWENNEPESDETAKDVYGGWVLTGSETGMPNPYGTIGDIGYYFVGDSLMSAGAPTDDNVVAKGFRAPYDGKVTISQKKTAKTEFGKENEIWGPNSGAEGKGLGIRISKNNTTKIWPAEEDKEYYSLDSSNLGKLAFTPLTEVEVKKGDILYFEAKNLAETDVNAWNCYVHWNPVITYTSIKPNDPTVWGDKKDVTLNPTYYIMFDSDLSTFSAENVEITGKLNDGSKLKQTPEVSEAYKDAGNTKQAVLSLRNLEKGAEYIVKLKNLSFMNTMFDKAYTYTFSFATKNDSEAGVKPEAVFTDGSGAEKTAAEALDLEQTYVTVSALNLSDYAGREATPIAAVYGADGTLKRVVLSPSVIKVKASENEAGEGSSVKLDLGNLKELNASKIKILLWDMTSGSAKPISVPVEAQK